MWHKVNNRLAIITKLELAVCEWASNILLFKFLSIFYSMHPQNRAFSDRECGPSVPRRRRRADQHCCWGYTSETSRCALPADRPASYTQVPQGTGLQYFLSNLLLCPQLHILRFVRLIVGCNKSYITIKIPNKLDITQLFPTARRRSAFTLCNYAYSCYQNIDKKKVARSARFGSP